MFTFLTTLLTLGYHLLTLSQWKKICHFCSVTCLVISYLDHHCFQVGTCWAIYNYSKKENVLMFKLDTAYDVHLTCSSCPIVIKGF